MLLEDLKDRLIKTLQTEEFKKILSSEVFYFDKAKVAYDDYLVYKDGDTEFFLKLLDLDYTQIQELAEQDGEIEEFIVRLERLVAYCDSHAKNKIKYNEYEDKRTIARAGIYQNAWTKQLIKYRIDRKSITQPIKNVFDFINRPIESISILSETHRRMISTNLFTKEYSRSRFVNDIKSFFEPLGVLISNEVNRTHLYTRLIYSMIDVWYDVINGLVGRDRSDWKDVFKEEMMSCEYGVLWWNPRPVGDTNTINKLEDKINKEGYFYLYYVADNYVTHRARVIDFCLAEDYGKKSSNWGTKKPVWYNKRAEDYFVGNDRSAAIMFLADEFIQVDPSFSVKDFQMYKDYSLPHMNNLSPYSSLLNNFEVEKDSELNGEFQNGTSDMLQIGRTECVIRDKNNVEAVLGVDDIADELADIIINMSTEQGRMVGVFGEWGRGKTFLINRLWAKIKAKSNKNIFRVDFHAWKYQDTPAIWAYLYESFADAYYKSAKSRFAKFWLRIWLNFKRNRLWSLIWFALILAVGSSLAIFHVVDIKAIAMVLISLGVAALTSILTTYLRYINSARELFRKYYARASFTHILGVQAEVQKELKILVKAWSGCKKKDFKIILFVDDIDRCSEEKIIQIIDSLRVMLEDEYLCEKIIVVAAVDERILKRAINVKYYPLLKVENSINKCECEDNLESTMLSMRSLVREYMDKLFIAGIKLGNLNPDEKDDFFIALTKTERDQSFEVTSFSELVAHKQVNMAYVIGRNNEVENNKGLLEDTSDESIDGESFLEKGDLDDNVNEEIVSGLLTSEELDALRIGLMQHFIKVTPRQIRIFYYRYLIAKHLLIRQYEKANRDNIWLNIDNSKLLIELLIKLSQHNDPDIISKERQRVVNIELLTCNVELLDDFEVNTYDYKMLICILDTVIGY